MQEVEERGNYLPNAKNILHSLFINIIKYIYYLFYLLCLSTAAFRIPVNPIEH